MSESPGPEELAPVHPWTRSWWGRLPLAYREADRAQNPEAGGMPLLRYMDGVGRIAGEMREISDGLYDGSYTDPDRAPDSALPWLAFLLGMSDAQRDQRPEILRIRIRALVTAGRTRVGTRQLITESAKEFLIPGAEARVSPHPSQPHVLVLHVRSFDVIDSDFETLSARVRSAGFLPAGHGLIVNLVSTTWDQWQEVAGETWDDTEQNIPTWADSDSAGVFLED